MLMAFAIDVFRIMYLTARRHDLVFQLQLVLNQKSQYGNLRLRMGQFQQQDYQALLSQMEKNMDMEAERIRTQEKAVSTELESVQKNITEDVKSFKFSGNS
jgi:hypothetical protein